MLLMGTHLLIATLSSSPRSHQLFVCKNDGAVKPSVSQLSLRNEFKNSTTLSNLGLDSHLSFAVNDGYFAGVGRLSPPVCCWL